MKIISENWSSEREEAVAASVRVKLFLMRNVRLPYSNLHVCEQDKSE